MSSSPQADTENKLDGLKSMFSKNTMDVTSYSCLLLISLFCVYEGCRRSVTYIKELRKKSEKVEVMSTKEVIVFPFMASATLFGAYVIFRLFSKQYTNMLLSVYFLAISVAAMFQAFRPLARSLITPVCKMFFANTCYRLTLATFDGQTTIEVPEEHSKNRDFSQQVDETVKIWEFDIVDMILMMLCVCFGVWNLLQKHWIGNNIAAISIAINAIEMLHLNNFLNGSILFVGLFLYDIFWVFGTDVMVSVAKNIEGPIKVVWPIDFLNATVWKPTTKPEDIGLALLGLGDIVIPGIFVALLKRFDVLSYYARRSPKLETDTTPDNIHSDKSQQPTSFYFTLCFVCYALALICTFIVMKAFKHAQPALLYIVPFCLIPVCLVALANNDFTALLQYEDFPKEDCEPSMKKHE